MDVNNFLDGVCYIRGNIQEDIDQEDRLKFGAQGAPIEVVTRQISQNSEPDEHWVRIRMGVGEPLNIFRFLSLTEQSNGNYVAVDSNGSPATPVEAYSGVQVNHMETYFRIEVAAGDPLSYCIINDSGRYLTINANHVFFEDYQPLLNGGEEKAPPQQKWKFTPISAGNGFWEDEVPTGTSSKR